MSTRRRFYTNAGPRSGFWRDEHGSITIGIYSDPACSKIPPLGIAFDAGSIADEGGAIHVWRLTVNKADLPGRWVLLDREFLPVEVVYSDVRGYGDAQAT